MIIHSEGTGPDLIVVHGWGMHCGVFADVLPELERRYTVHRVDLPGHGANHHLSHLPPLAEIADTLASRLPLGRWLGWSLGGQLAMTMAARHPQRVGGLVVVASTPRWIRREDWRHGMDADVFEAFADDLATDHEATWQRFLSLEVQGTHTARRDLRHLKALNRAWPAPAARVLTDGLARLKETDLRPLLPCLKVRTLVISGSRDRLVPPAAAAWLAMHLPNARYEPLAGLGHAPFIGDPELFLSSVLPFLAETGCHHV